MPVTSNRLHALDAVRALGLLAGVGLHSTMSFLPGFAITGWPIIDREPSTALAVSFYFIHMFRMTTFFFIAGWFGHRSLHRRGLGGFVRDRSMRIVVPLVVGWIVVYPLVGSTFAWASTAPIGGVQTAGPLPQQGLFAFPLLHFWFLYVLAWIYVGVLILRPVADAAFSGAAFRARVDAVVRWLVGSSTFVILLAAPIAAALYAAPRWHRWFGIPTPDQSLIPNIAAIVAFTGAFCFGWLMHRQPNLLDVWRRRWAAYLGLAIVLTVAALSIVGADPEIRRAPRDWGTVVYAMAYTAGVWAWTAGIIGMALRFFDDESPVRRYLSDASYWVYIAHLPLVFALQVVVRDLPWHWSLKFALIVFGTLSVLLAAYQLMVRSTFVGEVLSGRRQLWGSDPLPRLRRQQNAADTRPGGPQRPVHGADGAPARPR